MARLRPHWRKMTWVVLIWNILMVIWIVTGIATAPNGSNCADLTQQSCQAATDVGTGIGVILIVIIWALVDIILGIVWLVTKPRGQRDCPVCGNVVKRGITKCKSCGHDFAKV